MAQEKLTRKEFKSILNQARERLDSAEILLEKEKYRDSVSRSYYAVFDVVRGLLASRGIITKTHAGAFQQFALHFVKTGIFNKRIEQPAKPPF